MTPNLILDISLLQFLAICYSPRLPAGALRGVPALCLRLCPVGLDLQEGVGDDRDVLAHEPLGSLPVTVGDRLDDGPVLAMAVHDSTAVGAEDLADRRQAEVPVERRRGRDHADQRLV